MHQGPDGWWVQDFAGESVAAAMANGDEAQRRVDLQKACWHTQPRKQDGSCPICLMRQEDIQRQRNEISAKEEFVTNSLLNREGNQ